MFLLVSRAVHRQNCVCAQSIPYRPTVSAWLMSGVDYDIPCLVTDTAKRNTSPITQYSYSQCFYDSRVSV